MPDLTSTAPKSDLSEWMHRENLAHGSRGPLRREIVEEQSTLVSGYEWGIRRRVLRALEQLWSPGWKSLHKMGTGQRKAEPEDREEVHLLWGILVTWTSTLILSYIFWYLVTKRILIDSGLSHTVCSASVHILILIEMPEEHFKLLIGNKF